MEVEDLKGKLIVHVKAEDGGVDLITFNEESEEYHRYSLYGDDGAPNDCEVWLESVVGDLKDLIGEPILLSELVKNTGDVTTRDGYNDCGTWTFYKFATRKGYVDLRFCGRSNGYYSEEATLHGPSRVSKEYVDEQINLEKKKAKFKL